MGILIPRGALKNRQQTFKLFSNPVSGIACYWDPKSNYDLEHGGFAAIKDIKYSKSMLEGALQFWCNQMGLYHLRIKRIYNPLNSGGIDLVNIEKQLRSLIDTLEFVRNLPNHFLFSHRYVNLNRSFKHEPLLIQQKLLKTKYPQLDKIWFEKVTMQPVTGKAIEGLDIVFTIYLNEHPYIQRTKIAEVGQTEKGNVFIIRKKSK